jgi:hypothetical protein
MLKTEILDNVLYGTLGQAIWERGMGIGDRMTENGERRTKDARDPPKKLPRCAANAPWRASVLNRYRCVDRNSPRGNQL